MFTNYSQTYASQITALAGFVVVASNTFGWGVDNGSAVFFLGVLANLGGIIWALYHRKSKGDITVSGKRV